MSKQAALMQNGSSGTSYDPLGLIDLANGFKNDMTFNGLMFISLAFSILTLLVLSRIPGWHEEEDSEGSNWEVKQFPSGLVSRLTLACVAISSIMTLLSVFWQHMASANAATLIQLVAGGVVESKVGVAAMGLGWAIFFLNALVCLGVVLMIVSIRVLSQVAE